MERVTAARELLDATELTEYRTLAARQDELTHLIAELSEVERNMLALAA
jgi:transcription elongation GreA/GreB family factor